MSIYTLADNLPSLALPLFAERVACGFPSPIAAIDGEFT